MELGNFLGKLKGEKKQEPQQFLALVLTDEVVQAAVWQVATGQTEIAAIGTPVEWDGDTATTSELVTAVDATISSAVEGLSQEPSGVILGIPHTWTDKNGILGVKREFIKVISKELELQALGFVVITDSILSYLKLQEGTPTTSILIQVSRDELTLVLVRLGRIEAIETIGRSDDVVEDVTEGITRFKISDNLPSRIILFNGMHDLDEIIQNLLSIDWQAQFNFLHTPKIEALAKDVTIRALALAGGSEVAKSLGFTLTAPIVEAEPVVEPDEDLEEASPTEPDSSIDEVEESNVEVLTAEEIGFTTPKPTKTVPVKKEVGFIDPDDEPPSPAIALAKEGPTTPSKPKTPFVMPTFTLPQVKLPKLKLNFTGIGKQWWIIGGSLVGLVLLVTWLVWFMPKATVNIAVVPKTLEEDVNLTLSTAASSINFTDLVVPAELQTLEQSGEKAMETTGKKTVGETAQGEITIYNRTSTTKTFTKGTNLTAAGLKFSLDADVTVASKSAGSDYVDVPGKASVAVVASAIGAEGNIASGTEFTIASFGKDSYVGKNDAALSGGSSEEVQVVAKDDQANLAKSLTDELFEALESQVKSSSLAGTGTYLLRDSSTVETVSYSAKTGETAKSLTVKLTVKVSLLKYKTDDVTTLVNSAIDAAVPAGFVRANIPSTVDLSASAEDEEDTRVQGSAKVEVALLPVVDSKFLIGALKGKKVADASQVLHASVPGFASAEVVFTPRALPTKLKFIPFNPKNIKLNIAPLL